MTARMNIQQGSRIDVERNGNEKSPLLSKQNAIEVHSNSIKEKMNAMESLEYHIVDNVARRRYLENANLYKKNMQKTSAKWFFYVLIGFIIGFIAVGIRQSVNHLEDLRMEFTRQYVDHKNYSVAFMIYLAFNLLYIAISCGVVLICGPLAGGSGIPEVKGYLNGVRVVNTINLKSFVGKVISIIFSYSSSLALGPEGPMVHIGSMLGAGLSAAKSRTLGIRLPTFESLRNDRDQRDFIASGAAAGITAAFGTPVGGVLFALEETASFWSRELTWRTLFACMLSVITVNLLSSIGSPNSMVHDYGLLTFGVSSNYLYRYQELFPFIILGILGGLLASLFIKLNVSLNKWRRDWLSNNKMLRMFEALLVTALTAAITFGLPMARPCESKDDIKYLANICDKGNSNSTQPESIFCEASEFNDLANLMIIPAEESLRLLFSRTDELFSFESLIIYFVCYFVLLMLTSGLAIANGLFVPMMLLGATLGRIIGKTVQIMFPDANPPIDPSIYALVGSTAMMSGFSRITISLVVIIIELTENTQFLLPIMLAVMCAKWVGDALCHSIYDEFMDLKSIPFLEHHPPQITQLLTVTNVMNPNVVSLKEIDSVAKAVEVLKYTEHAGFPVVRYESPERPRTYEGFILRKQLLILLERQLFHRKTDTTPGMLDHEYLNVLMNHKNLPMSILDKLPPKDAQLDLFIDLRPYMDKSHLIIQSSFSFSETYHIFKVLGLRHLPVVDDKNQVIGMITRHDLLSFYTSSKDH